MEKRVDKFSANDAIVTSFMWAWLWTVYKQVL